MRTSLCLFLLALGGCAYLSDYKSKHGKLYVYAEPSTAGVVSAGCHSMPEKYSPYQWDYAYYPYKEDIILSATPFAGWKFRVWSDGNTNAIRDHYRIIWPETTVTAHFTRP